MTYLGFSWPCSHDRLGSRRPAGVWPVELGTRPVEVWGHETGGGRDGVECVGINVEVWHRFAMRRRRRQWGQDLHVTVRPEGRTDNPLQAGMYGTLGACCYGPPEGGLWHRAWPVTGSFVPSSVRLGRTTTLPTSGHNHQACAKPAPDSRLLSSRCLSWAGTCILRASTSARRQRQRHWACGRWNRGGVAGQGMEAWPVKARVSGNVSVRAAPAPKAIQNQTANDSHPCSKHGSSGCSGTVVWIPTRR